MVSGSYWGASKPPPGTPLLPGGPSTSALVGCWPINEGAGQRLTDATGRNAASSFVGAPAWKGTAMGPALANAGSADLYASIPTNPVQYPVLPRGFSVEAWVVLDSVGGGDREIITTFDSAFNTGWTLRNSAANAVFQIKFGSFGFVGVTGASTLVTGRLYQFLGTWDGAAMAIYVNGALDGTNGSAADTPTTPTGPLLFGGKASNNGFNGKIGLVRLWQRALPAAEIRDLYGVRFGMFAAPTWRRVFVPGGAVAVSAADTATAADAATLAATVPVTEAPTATEAGAVTATAPTQAETPTATEAPAVSAAVPVTEAGAGAEGQQVGVPVSEAGAATEQPTVSAGVPATDTGAATEAPTVGPQAAETALVLDASVVQAAVPVIESGLATDLGTVLASLPTSDTGQADDLGMLVVAAQDAETLTGSDLATLLAQVAAAETAQASEDASVQTSGGDANLSVSDTGAATEQPTVSASVPALDLAGGLDLASLAASVAAFDASNPTTEFVTLFAALQGAETVTGFDAPSLLAALLAPENAAALEAAGVSVAAPETGTVTEGTVSQAIIDAIDQAGATETAVVDTGVPYRPLSARAFSTGHTAASGRGGTVTASGRSGVVTASGRGGRVTLG